MADSRWDTTKATFYRAAIWPWPHDTPPLPPSSSPRPPPPLLAARNSLGKNLLGELQDAVAALHHDRETRVVIFNSAVEKVFCAGADLKERATMPEEEVGPFVERLRATFTAIEQVTFLPHLTNTSGLCWLAGSAGSFSGSGTLR